MNGDQRSDVYVQEKQDFTGDAITQLKEYHRGFTVLVAFWELVEPRKQDAESLQRALTVGWCVELLQALFLVANDITDSLLTICWFQKPGVGLDAISDAILVEACIYCLLKLYCWEQPYCQNLIQLFLQSFYQIEIGQTLDLITAPQGNADLGRFTEKRYKSTVNFYFYIPVAAAMYMAGIDGEKEHDNAKKILLEMGEGEFFQIRMITFTSFGDPSVTSKVGTDIQDNKCSWLLVQCLQRATPEHYQILKENYRQKETKKVAPVKAVYEELDLPAEDSYSHIMGLIEQYAAPLSPAIFLGLTCKIYKSKM
uniref:Farnesyl pyrophosphate synthase n=1 Tax=Gorilla gorilla gorilla TaxID=9595 RepID=A0A2I2Z3N7_GORGO